MTFDVPQGSIFRVDEVDLRASSAPHPSEAENGAAIAANWMEEKRSAPGLYDGRVMLLSDLCLHQRRLAGTSHVVRYSTFLYWRRLRPVASAGHVFAHALPVTTDGALIAIRMASGTVNAGLVYFAAGSFEPIDFVDGRADVAGNMAREVAEETGLDLNLFRAESGFHGLASDVGTVLFRRYHLDMDAREAVDRIARHVAADPDPEIEGAVVITREERTPAGLAPHMPPLIDWHFG